jgi:hypothetical protein
MSACASAGTHSTTIGDDPAASVLLAAPNRAARLSASNLARASAATARALSPSREPIVTSKPAVAQRSASPSPCRSVPPITAMSLMPAFPVDTVTGRGH